MFGLAQLQHEHVNLHKQKPLASNRLVTFVNHFLTNIVEQLNELTAMVDSKLLALNNKLNICQSNLVILEMKLNSISGLSLPSTNNSPLNNLDPQVSSVNENINSDVGESSRENEDIVEEKVPPQDDSLLAKYRKMLHLGIPLGAVHQKMQTEGVDPSLLPR